MHDIRAIRDNPAAFDEGLRKRGLAPLSTALLLLDDTRKTAIAALQATQEQRNAASKEIGKAKAAKEEARAQALMQDVAALKGKLLDLEQAEREADAALEKALKEIPNLPGPDVPEGLDETGNSEQNRFAGSRPFLKSGTSHDELGTALGLMDFEAAARLSGARFTVLKGALAQLERALGQFMLDLHVREHGYTEISPPLLVREAAMEGTGQLPKFEDDLFRAGATHFLIPTAEVPLTNLVRDSILAEEELPLRYTALTPCFRAEAGSAGRDTKGMLRQHQFWKCELVSLTTPEHSASEHEHMLSHAEAVLQKLDLPYRVVTLCTGDMGFSATKTYDIEVWLPSQQTWREISSVSMCSDFQARRMEAKFRKDGKTHFLHTLNGSGVAVGRALIAVMENYQNPDGSISIPAVLRTRMGDKERIGG
jgi:seryl-tRNA synthetase